MGHLTFQQAVGTDEMFACVVGWPARRLKLDMVAKEMLADVPRFLRTQVDREMKRLGESSDPSSVLVGLHQALRNSVHVSEIGEIVVVETMEDPTVEVMRCSVQRLVNLTFNEGYKHIIASGTPAEQRTPTPEAATWTLAA